jgi:hypothetical protein
MPDLAGAVGDHPREVGDGREEVYEEAQHCRAGERRGRQNLEDLNIFTGLTDQI